MPIAQRSSPTSRPSVCRVTCQSGMNTDSGPFFLAPTIFLQPVKIAAALDCGLAKSSFVGPTADTRAGVKDGNGVAELIASIAAMSNQDDVLRKFRQEGLQLRNDLFLKVAV